MNHILFYTSQIKVRGAVQAGPIWLLHSDFPSCSESPEIWHVYSFCVQKCSCGFFFKNAETYRQNCVKILPLPPPISLSTSKQHRISIHESQSAMHGSFMLLEGGGGGGGWVCEKKGVDFQERVWSLVSPLVEKKRRESFSQKRSLHAKFQWIVSNLKNRYEIVISGWLAWSPSSKRVLYGMNIIKLSYCGVLQVKIHMLIKGNGFHI